MRKVCSVICKSLTPLSQAVMSGGRTAEAFWRWPGVMVVCDAFEDSTSSSEPTSALRSEKRQLGWNLNCWSVERGGPLEMCTKVVHGKFDQQRWDGEGGWLSDDSLI